MRFQRSRAAVLGAAVITLTLTACAPPGQVGEPGVAATYEGTSVTNVRLDEISQAWIDDTKGTDPAERRQILTIELLREDLLAKCKELGYPVTWSTAKAYADQWLSFKGVSGEASDDVIAATQGILALTIVAYTDQTLANLTEISDNVAKTVVASPRSGEYSTEALITSVKNAMQTATDQQLGSQYSYIAMQTASGFADEDRSWFDRGTVASS